MAETAMPGGANPADGIIPKAPKGLKTAGRRFWREILGEYEFPSAREMLMLEEEAAKTADIVARLQAIVDNAGTLRTTGSRGQDVGIPELDALRAYRAQFAALVKQLDLPSADDDYDEDTHRNGPMTRSEAGKVGAAARWSHRNGQGQSAAPEQQRRPKPMEHGPTKTVADYFKDRLGWKPSQRPFHT